MMLLIRFLTLGATLFIVACAPTQMTKEEWHDLIEAPAKSLDEAKSCCVNLEDIEYARLADEEVDLYFDLQDSALIRTGDGARAIAVGVDLSEVPPGSVLELMSFSDKRRGLIRFDKLLFLRPNMIFLNPEFEVVREVADPRLCWGSKGGGGLWTRVELPKEQARYLVLYSSIARPEQLIDTRSTTIAPSAVAGVAGGKIIEGISEARASYHATAYVGLEGLLSIEPVDRAAPFPGRCRGTSPYAGGS